MFTNGCSAKETERDDGLKVNSKTCCCQGDLCNDKDIQVEKPTSAPSGSPSDPSDTPSEHAGNNAVKCYVNEDGEKVRSHGSIDSELL